MPHVPSSMDTPTSARLAQESRAAFGTNKPALFRNRSHVSAPSQTFLSPRATIRSALSGVSITEPCPLPKTSAGRIRILA